MAPKDRTRQELISELVELRGNLTAHQRREAEQRDVERELRAELAQVLENARGTNDVLRSTIVLTQEKNRELRNAHRQAESATLAKSRFLTNMSHELRTPMTAILGYTEALIDECLGREEHEPLLDHLQTVLRNAQKLMRTLSDILDLSRLESGDVEIEKHWVSPTETVEDVSSMMRDAAVAKGIGFEVSSRGEILRRIHTDPMRLRQILVNLLKNAVQFTEQGGVRVLLQCDGSLCNGEPGLRVTVSDTGCGMSPEALESLFDAFSQADASLTREHGGSGLGLAIARKLAEHLGGSLAVDSLEGRGSDFVLTIPTGRSDDVSDEEEPTARHSALGSDSAQTELGVGTRTFMESVSARDLDVHVLFVEDGEDNRRLIKMILHKAGFSVTLAKNGREGVEQALAAVEERRPFDLILMDMYMPVLDGYEATRQLRDAGLETPIIALTAHAGSSERDRCLEAGCSAFATKPVDRRSLVELILEQLDKVEAS